MSAPSHERPEIERALAQHELRMLDVLGGALVVTWVGYASLNVVLGIWIAVPLQLAMGLFAAILWWRARAKPERVSMTAHALAMGSAVTMFALAMLSGQAQAQATWQIWLIPIATATVLGWRRALPEVIGVGALFVLVHVLGRVAPIEAMFDPSPMARTIGGTLIGCFALGYVAYSRRITHRTIREAKELQLMIEAQTAELTRARDEVAASRDEALAALRGKTEFLATLSHELRAPLNGLLGLSSVLLESKLGAEQKDLVRTLHQSATSMRKILNDVLDLTRIEAGKLELREESVDVREVIGEVLDVFAPSAADKGIELAAVVDAEVPQSVRLDPVRFGQVLTNLVGNALKFTEQGEILVELAMVRSEACLRVRDTGPGIAPAERDRLFKPYEQTRAGEISREIGSGLGLWIAHRIVTAMGGTIGVESELGNGSCFSVRWRLERGEELDRSSTFVRAGVRALVVEDHPASLRSIEAIATGLGIQLVTATSIAEATKLARELSELDLVLVDATLPGATPAAAAEALRAIPLLRRLPMVSVLPPRTDLVRTGIQLPFVASTLKPYRRSRVEALLSDVLAARPAMPTPISVAPWRPLDVLVVDDDSTNRLVASLLLEKAGMKVHLAESGEEALRKIAGDFFDVVLLDLHMKGIDGLETARRIRADHDRKGRLWIVALTASVYEEDRQRCLDAGMDDFIPKPIEIGLFRAALERAQRAVRRRSGTFSAPQIVAQDGGVRPRELQDILQMLGADSGELALLVDDYVRSSAELCAELRTAVAKGDAKSAERATHTLASSSAQLGAYR
ncbi:MAG: response regulator, partial [Sandaracinaceae bacterium]|nr:response regulator [Sandaracinaceae bacterium]